MQQELLTRIENLEKIIADMQDSSRLPLQFQRALVGRGFIRTDGIRTGILKANGLNPATTIAGVSKDVFTSNVSGGAVNVELIAVDGVITQ